MFFKYLGDLNINVTGGKEVPMWAEAWTKAAIMKLALREIFLRWYNYCNDSTKLF